MPHRLALLLLAAGQSSRMRGADKLLKPVAGQPLLARMISQAQATGLPVYVTLPALDHPRATTLQGATAIAVPDAAEGMGASIRRGITALPTSIDGVLMLPADMPEITTRDFTKLIEGFEGPEGPILRATGTEAGETRQGHPVLFPRRCFAALAALQGDEGARSVLRSEALKLIALPEAHALTDLDTPEAWAAWRAAQDTRP